MIGVRLTDIHVADSNKNQVFIRALIKNGYRIRYAESEEIDVNGQKRYFLNSGVGFVENDCVTGGWGTQIDITELRQAQAALIEERIRAEQERAAELVKANEALGRSLDKLANERNLDSFLEHVLQEAIKMLDGAIAQIFLYNSEFDTLMPSIGVDAQGAVFPAPGLMENLPIREPFPANITKAWERMLNQRSPVYFDLEQDAEDFWVGTIDWHHRMGHRGSICTALMMGEQPLGMLSLAFRDRAEFTTSEFEFFQALAQQATLAIQLTYLAEQARQAAIAQEQEKAAQERAAELAKANDALKRSLDALATDPDLNCFLGHVLKVMAQELDAPVVEHWVDASSNIAYLNLSCCCGELLTPEQQALDPRVQGVRIPPELMKHNSLLHRQQPVIVEDLVSDPVQIFVFDPIGFDLAAWSAEYGVRKYIQLPLVLGERSIGTLCVYIPGNRTFTEHQIELSRALAQQVTLATQLTQLAEAAKQVAIAREQEKAETAILAERNRMAREIHDTLAQGFTGIVVHLEGAENVLTEDPEKARSRLDRARQLARESLAEARRSVHALRPQSLESADLCAAIKQLIQQMTEDTPLHVQFDCEAPPNVLPTEIESNLLRITQEALTNSIKHAAATQVTITLSSTLDTLCLSIHDNGQGFEVQSSNLYKPGSTEGFGLVGMRDRAHSLQGQFDLTSQLGSGTTLQVTVPCPLANWKKSS